MHTRPPAAREAPLRTSDRLGSPADCGPFAIDLLRRIDPERMVLYGGRRPARDEWDRHCGQYTEFVVAATGRVGAMRHIAGTLELRLVANQDGTGGMIDRIYVARNHRRCGLASRLIAFAIRFARIRGLVALRENIPNLLARDPGTDRWRPYLPGGEGWGGLRSLGATVNACIIERQPCRIDQVNRDRGGDRIGARLELPLAPMPLAKHGVVLPSRASLRDRLLVDLAVGADVSPAGVRVARAE